MGNQSFEPINPENFPLFAEISSCWKCRVFVYHFNDLWDYVGIRVSRVVMTLNVIGNQFIPFEFNVGKMFF